MTTEEYKLYLNVKAEFCVCQFWFRSLAVYSYMSLLFDKFSLQSNPMLPLRLLVETLYQVQVLYISFTRVIYIVPTLSEVFIFCGMSLLTHSSQAPVIQGYFFRQLWFGETLMSVLKKLWYCEDCLKYNTRSCL